MRKWYYIVGLVVAIGGIIILGLIVGPKPPISKSIKTQLTSVLLVPKSNSVAIDRASVKYASDLKLLSFAASYSGTKLTISEQPTPDTFTDIPQFYDKVVTGMNEYQKFDTAAGTVHLTRPKDQGGKQAGVLNTKGTLMFVKSENDLTDDQWRKFFNSLDVVR